jgi:hypothetical protein
MATKSNFPPDGGSLSVFSDNHIGNDLAVASRLDDRGIVRSHVASVHRRFE